MDKKKVLTLMAMLTVAAMVTACGGKKEEAAVTESEAVESQPAKKPCGFLRAVGFDAVAKKTSIKTEIVAGIVTFLAMAYILLWLTS